MSDRPPASTSDSLVEAVPDFVAFLRRDGVVLRHLGGRRVLPAGTDAATGRRLGVIWPEPIGSQLRLALRRAIAERGSAEIGFLLEGRRYEARFEARGPDRALCVIRDAGQSRREAEREGVRGGDPARREFYDRLAQAIAAAKLEERPLALVLVHFDGMDDVGRVIDPFVSRQLRKVLVERADSGESGGNATGQRGGADRRWVVAPLGEHGLALIVEGYADREPLRERLRALRQSLAAPVPVGDASFAVTPSLGVALLGVDGQAARELMERARAALLDARRSEDDAVSFYSDGSSLGAVATLDFGRELRNAMDSNALSMRYSIRADLDTGRPVTACAYLRWPQALRRELRAADFLPLAESAGLALELSRWALARFRRDLPALRSALPGGMRWSFGALRQHVANEALLCDVEELLATGEVSASELELRVSERSVSSLTTPGRLFRALADKGISLVVDEFGRGHSALPRLARLPLAGLQVDRSIVVASRDDAVALRAVRAALMMAAALDLMPMVSGVDDEADRVRLRELGGLQGLGDLFGQYEAQSSAPGAQRQRA